MLVNQQSGIGRYLLDLMGNQLVAITNILVASAAVCIYSYDIPVGVVFKFVVVGGPPVLAYSASAVDTSCLLLISYISSLISVWVSTPLPYSPSLPPIFPASAVKDVPVPVQVRTSLALCFLTFQGFCFACLKAKNVVLHRLLHLLLATNPPWGPCYTKSSLLLAFLVS